MVRHEARGARREDFKAEPLRCEGLDCGYPGRTVLTGVTVRVAAGETVALLGPNGGGKSTLMRTWAGLLPPLAGEVWLEGTSVQGLREDAVARRVAVVPQNETTPFPFRVREVVTMGRLSLGNGLLDTAEDRMAAEAAMARADCLTLADRPITELSGGEKARALIARALAQDAPLMLMDEPTAHLDAPHAAGLARLVRELAGEGRAVVAAVHDLNLAALVADRAILVADGRVMADGPVEAVLTGSALEEAYAAPFERVRAESGRLLVVPR